MLYSVTEVLKTMKVILCFIHIHSILSVHFVWTIFYRAEPHSELFMWLSKKTCVINGKAAVQ